MIFRLDGEKEKSIMKRYGVLALLFALSMITPAIYASDVTVVTAPYVRVHLAGQTIPNLLSPHEYAIDAVDRSDYRLPIVENRKNLRDEGSLGYDPVASVEAVYPVFQNFAEEELIFLGVAGHSEIIPQEVSDAFEASGWTDFSVFPSREIDVEVNSVLGGQTGAVSLALSGGASSSSSAPVTYFNWNIVIEENVTLRNIFLFSNSQSFVTLKVNGEPISIANGAEVITSAGIRIQSHGGECGYALEKTWDYEYCNLYEILGIVRYNDSVMANPYGYNHLADHTSLKVTNFSGVKHASKFIVDVDTIPNADTFSGIEVSQYTDDGYRLKWFEPPGSEALLLEGVVQNNELGQREAITWTPVQRGGENYRVFNQALGQYQYRLVNTSTVHTPTGAVPIYEDIAISPEISVGIAPILKAFSFSESTANGDEGELGDFISYTGDYRLTIPFTGVDERQLVLERKDIGGAWSSMSPDRFNMVSREFEWEYKNQTEIDDYTYRARLAYDSCALESIVSDVLNTALGTSTFCADPAFSTYKNVSVQIAVQTLDSDVGGFSWNAVQGAPHYILKELQADGSWQTIYEGSNTVWPGTVSASKYRVQSCALVGETPTECSESTEWVASGIASAPDPAPKPQEYGYGDDTVGATAGQFRVNEAGAATYSIPIMTGAGTAGVLPDVSLNYSSQAGRGIAGKGWSIGGGSAISRCRQTLQIDQQSLPIQWNDEDRFCLDGQRLILIESEGTGTYGSSGAIYRTEIDSFARITSIGGTSANPNYFTVERKDGSTSFYGNTADSKQNVGIDKTITWGINQFQDSFGNPIKFTYTTTGGFTLSKIYYAFGANKTVPTSNSMIEFVYTSDRPDPSMGYIAGYPLSNTLRLQRVDSYNADDNLTQQLMRSYHLEYAALLLEPRPQDVLLSRLDNIKECIDTSATQCLPATNFEWGRQLPLGDASSTLARTRDHLAGTGQNISAYTQLDFNGDGLTDIAWMVQYPDNISNFDQEFRYVEATAGGFDSKVFNNGAPFYHTSDNPADHEGYDLYPIDYNADGRDDIIRFRNKTNTWELFLSTPQNDGSWRLKLTDITLPFNGWEDIEFADINGDGLVDAVQYQFNANLPNIYGTIEGNYVNVYQLERDVTQPLTSATPYKFSLANSNNLTPIVSGTFFYIDKANFNIADLDGDGNSELVLLIYKYTNCSLQYYSSEEEMFCSVQSRNSFAFDMDVDGVNGSISLIDFGLSAEYLSAAQLVLGDINGDGLPDFLYRKADSWYRAINKGDFTFETASLDSGIPLSSTTSTRIADFNGDGYGDLYWHDKSTDKRNISYWQPAANGGAGAFNPDEQWFSAVDHIDYSFQNADGDAGLELVALHQLAGAEMRVDVLDLDTLPDGHANIKTITNGLGATTNIEYSPLSDTDHYYRITGINPVQTTQTTCISVFGANLCFENPVTVGDATAFYQQMNAPFSDLPSGSQIIHPEAIAPILEVDGLLSIVERVSSSAPAAHDINNSLVDYSAESAISYLYHQAKIQAAGRGYLGFKKIESIDEQTGINTTTQYRQDFPFIGVPIKTEVRTADEQLLSQSTSEWQLKSYSKGKFGSSAFNSAMIDAQSLGCKALGALQLIQTKSVETSFGTTSAYNQALTVSSSPLQTLVTTNFYDDQTGSSDKHGNLYEINLKNYIGDETGTLASEQIVKNLYNPTNGWDSEDAKRLGRLSETTVQDIRYIDVSGDDDIKRQSNFTYKPLNQGGVLLTETIEQGSSEFEVKTTYEYDAQGNKTKATQVATDIVGLQADAASRESNWVYDPSGRYVSQTINDKGHVLETVIERNHYGSPLRVANIDGVVSETDYTPFGKPYLTYSPSGAWKQTAYGNCLSVSCPSGAVFSIVTREASGSGVTEYFDVLGRSIETQQIGFNGTLIVTRKEYDALGRVKRQSEPFYNFNTPYWSEFSYDILGRPLKVLSPTESLPIEQAVTYNGFTTTTKVLSANLSALIGSDIDQQSVQTVNVLGEVVEVIDDRNGKVNYKYDAKGNLTLTTTTAGTNGVAEGVVPSSIDIVLHYDLLGRKTSMEDPDKGDWIYDYNGFGELISQTDANGNITLMVYDSLGRMVERQDHRDNDSDPSTTNTTLDGNTHWAYDTVGNGRLAQVQDLQSGFLETYSYDSLGRNNSTTTRTGLAANDETYTQLVTFDQFGRTFQKFDASGGNQGTQYAYNAQGYLEKVSETRPIAGNHTTYFTITQMTARGQVSGVTWGNGYTSTRHFDFARGIPKQLITVAGIHSVQDLKVNFDDFGNLISRINEGVGDSANTTAVAKSINETFSYDSLNRLREVTRNNVVTQAMTYDSFGNIKNKSDVSADDYRYGETINGSMAGPHAVTDSGDGIRYRYDRNGNMVSDGTNLEVNNQRTLVYSSFDKPTQINKGNHKINFEYGPSRSRYKRIDTNTAANVVEKTTLYMGSVERIEHSDNTIELKRYIEGQILVTETSIGGSSSSIIQYLIKDYLGSTELVLNHSIGGDIVAEDMSFDAWGQRRNGDNWTPMTMTELMSFDSSTTTKGFTGHEMLDEVGLVHMNGRIYDPRLGRFMQADSFIQAGKSTQSYNRYSYGFNSPLAGTDPSGNIWGHLVAAAFAYAAGEVAQKTENRWLSTVATLVGCLSGYCTSTSFGATYGATNDLGQAFKSGAIAAFSEWAFTNIGEHFAGAGPEAAAAASSSDQIIKFAGVTTTRQVAIQHIAAHAAVGGVISVLQGGKFGHGFISAGFTKGLTGAIAGGNVATRYVATVVVGGTASKISGGKFANGAVTASYQFLFNELSSAAQKGQLTHDYAFETVICSRSGSACTADNVWGVVKNNSVPLQDGTLTDGTVSKIPGIGTVTTRVNDSSYTLVNQTHDDHLFKHGELTRLLVVRETTISVRTVGTGTNTNRFTQGANYAASPYFKALDANIKATIGIQQFKSDVKSFFD